MHYKTTTSSPLILYYLIAFILSSCGDNYRTDDIEYKFSGINISARIYIPEGDGRFPAVVIVPSAEPDTKDTYSDYAEYFAAHGIATICYDKRGCGESGGNIWKASFTDLFYDAYAGIQYIKSLSFIDTSKMGLLGQSQGGMYIFMADSLTKDVSFIIDVSGSPGTPLAQSDYNIHSKMLENGASTEYTDSLVSLMHDYIIYLRERKNYESIKERYDAALRHPQKNIADKILYFDQFHYMDLPEKLPSYEEMEMYPFMRSYDFQSGPSFQTLHTPALIIYGKKDFVIPAEKRYYDAKKFAEHNSKIQVKLYENANHGLKEQSVFGLRYPKNYMRDLSEWIKSRE